MTTRKITNEDEAIQLLKELIEGYRFEEADIVEFEAWPRFIIRIKGTDFDGTIPTRIMPPLLVLQREIHRTYCLTTYGDDNLRRLTQKDREQLELVVRVDKGSSFFETLLSEPLAKTLQDAASRMSPEQLTIVVIVTGFLLTSVTGWRYYLNAKIREKELDHDIELSRLEKEKMEIVAKARQMYPEVEKASAGADELRESVLTKLKASDNVEIASPPDAPEKREVVIDGTRAREITYKPREQSVERMIEGEFMIESADFTKADGVRVVLMRTLDGYSFAASIPIGVLGHDQIEALKSNSWEHKQLTMSLLVKELHGGYRSAKVISVSDDQTADEA